MGCAQGKSKNSLKPTENYKQNSQKRSSKTRSQAQRDNISNERQISNSNQHNVEDENPQLEELMPYRKSYISSNDKPNLIKNQTYKKNSDVIESKFDDIEGDQTKMSIPFRNNQKNKGLIFDDQETLDTKQGSFQKIHAIKIAYTDQQIEGIQIAYEMSNGNIVTGANNNEKQKLRKQSCNSQSSESNPQINSVSTNDNYEEVFEIPVDDYLVEIKGRTSKNLTQIQFLTYKGEESKVFGNCESGQPFSVRKRGHTFGPFSGSFSRNNDIQKLSFSVLPLPSDFSENLDGEQFKKVV